MNFVYWMHGEEEMVDGKWEVGLEEMDLIWFGWLLGFLEMIWPTFGFFCDRLLWIKVKAYAIIFCREISVYRS